jgi:hypothetical protein
MPFANGAKATPTYFRARSGALATSMDIFETFHLRATAELPFTLGLKTGYYFCATQIPGTAIPFRVERTPAWVFGYRANEAYEGIVLSKIAMTARIAAQSNIDNDISNWAKSAGLSNVVPIAARTIIEIYLPLTEEELKGNLEDICSNEKDRKAAIYAVNEIIQRYQASALFSRWAGIAGLVSETELLYFSLQVFNGDKPLTKSVVMNSPPLRHSTPNVPEFTDEQTKRFISLSKTSFVPLWLGLALQAHSLLYRQQLELSIMTWFQALEVGIDTIEQVREVKTSGAIETRICILARKILDEEIAPEIVLEIKAVRQLRNRIVHEGYRLPFLTEEADAISRTCKDALRIIDMCIQRAIVERNG